MSKIWQIVVIRRLCAPNENNHKTSNIFLKVLGLKCIFLKKPIPSDLEVKFRILCLSEWLFCTLVSWVTSSNPETFFSSKVPLEPMTCFFTSCQGLSVAVYLAGNTRNRKMKKNRSWPPFKHASAAANQLFEYNASARFLPGNETIHQVLL